VRKGRETEPFERAVELEPERSARSAYARDHLSYLARGYYADTLEAFYEHVAPEQVLLLTLDELRRDPRATLGRVYELIGVDPGKGLDGAGRVHNPNERVVPRRWANSPVIKPVERAYSRATSAVVARAVHERSRRRQLKTALSRPFVTTVTADRMPEDVRARLVDRYRAANTKLAELTGLDVSSWSAA
jgi:hypothetical protein